MKLSLSTLGPGLLLGIFVGVWLACPATLSAATKSEQLRQAMAEIALLNSQLMQRKADAADIRESLAARCEEFKNEFRRTKGEMAVETESEAKNIPRIWYDLMLIAEIQAYMNRYAQKIRYYRVAIDRLSYLYQQADDDLKIVTTLSGMKIDALLSQTGKVLEAYLPDAQTLVIHPDSLVIDPPETVWRTLAAER